MLYGALGVNKRTAQGETVVNRLIVLFTLQIKGVFVLSGVFGTVQNGDNCVFNHKQYAFIKSNLIHLTYQARDHRKQIPSVLLLLVICYSVSNIVDVNI